MPQHHSVASCEPVSCEPVFHRAFRRPRYSLVVCCLAVLSCQATVPGAQVPEPGSTQQSSSTEAVLAAPLRAPGKAQPGVTSDCGEYAVMARGSLQFMNNVWAREKAKGGFEQCVLRRGADAQAQFGWTWAWPGFEPLGYGFPEIIFGWKPWSDASTDAQLPIQVSSLRELTVRYAVETESTGKHTLAASMWLTSSGQATAPNPLAIASEFAIWLDYPEVSTPSGQQTLSLQVEGVDYELWHTANHGDRGNGTGWDLYYLKGPHHRLQGTLKLERFLEALASKRLVTPEQFVASVEFGNELMGGSGTTWVSDFHVAVTPR